MEADDARPKRKGVTLLLGAALLLGALLSACALVLGPSSSELDEIREVVKEEQTLVLDVRGPDEFADGHLEGAVNIPVGELEGRLDELGPKDRPLVVY